MTTKSLADIYGGEGGEATIVPESVYDVLVKDARIALVKEGKSGLGQVFLDLEVLNGPSAGALVEVSVHVPDPTNRNALFHFSNKTAAFSAAIKTAIAANGAATNEAILTTIAEAMKGKTVSAEIGVQKEGTYAGQNELKKTTPTDVVAPAVSVPVAGVVTSAPTAAAVAPVAVDAVTDVTEPDLPF